MSAESQDHFYDSADGLRLYCRVFPARQLMGLTVLCLPGLTRNNRDFAPLARHLSARRQVLCADLRGRGRSAWDHEPSRYQLPTYVSDSGSLLDSLGVPRVVIIGTSLGAMMGIAMAAATPQRVAGVVMNDAGPEIDPVGLRRIAGYAGKLPPVSTWEEAAAQAKRVYGGALPGLTDAQWLDYAERGYRAGPSGAPVADVDPAIAKAFNDPVTGPVDLWPLFARIRGVPLLVIRGALSDLLSAATVARMVRENSEVTHIEVANRGHTPLLDEPECLAAIDEFLERHG